MAQEDQSQDSGVQTTGDLNTPAVNPAAPPSHAPADTVEDPAVQPRPQDPDEPSTPQPDGADDDSE